MRRSTGSEEEYIQQMAQVSSGATVGRLGRGQHEGGVAAGCMPTAGKGWNVTGPHT